MDFLLSFLNSLPGAVGQGLAWGVMAVGVYITYRILDVADLTVDGSLATGGAVCAVLISMGVNPWAAMLAALLAGMLAGLATGVFHTVCGIPAILSGILTQLALYSINLRIMAIGDETSKTKSSLAISVDRHDLLISNGNMARAQGINTDVSKVMGLVVSNGLVAMAGALLAQYQGSATIDMGRGAIVIGLAAVIIGEVLLSGVFRNFALKLLSCVIGAIIYYAVITLVLRLGLETTDLKRQSCEKGGGRPCLT